MLMEKFLDESEIFHHFQPIFNLNDWSIIGFEGLFRSRDNRSSEELFSLARTQNKLYELDSFSINRAALTFQNERFSKKNGKLFLSVFPSSLQQNNIETFIKRIMENLQVSSQQIVLEIRESEMISDITQFSKIIDKLKNKGIFIALSDFGKVTCDIQKFIDLEPDYIKLGRHFSDNLICSKKKQYIVETLVKYSHSFKFDVIIEGLETSVDLAFSKVLGIPYGQGNVLSKPSLLRGQSRRF